MDLALLLEEVRPCIEEAAAEVRRFFRSGGFDVTEKGPNDLLTSADLASNDILQKGLSAALPEAAWISEESAVSVDRRQKEYAWIVDPIDGTWEFAHGVPEFSISVGLVRGHEAILGLVALPASEEVVAGAVGSGVFLFDKDGRRPCGLASPPAERLEDASILVSATEHRKSVFRDFPPEWHIQPTGSVARKLALVAAGRADLNISLYPKNEWDVCGGCALILAAGGRTLHYDSSSREWIPHRFNGEDLRSLGLIAGPAGLGLAFAGRQKEEGWMVRSQYG